MPAHILYSFRRCPYAMRARMALRLSGQAIILREILLKDKPAEMLAISPKATVPVLQLADNSVIDESLDIAYWALKQHDPECYLPATNSDRQLSDQLIRDCDSDFKYWLDRYKYADRFPEQSAEHYRQQGELYLQTLDNRLKQQAFLLNDKPALVDIAIFPFIRQFASVDKAVFAQNGYTALSRWLNYHLNSDLFASIMQKHPPWAAGQAAIFL